MSRPSRRWLIDAEGRPRLVQGSWLPRRGRPKRDWSKRSGDGGGGSDRDAGSTARCLRRSNRWSKSDRGDRSGTSLLVAGRVPLDGRVLRPVTSRSTSCEGGTLIRSFGFCPSHLSWSCQAAVSTGGVGLGAPDLRALARPDLLRFPSPSAPLLAQPFRSKVLRAIVSARSLTFRVCTKKGRLIRALRCTQSSQ